MIVNIHLSILFYHKYKEKYDKNIRLRNNFNFSENYFKGLVLQNFLVNI